MPRHLTPQRTPTTPRLGALRAALLGLAAAAALAPATAVAQELPVQTGESAKISGRISGIADTDLFGLELFDGDRVKVKVKESGPEQGLKSTLKLLDPDGVELTNLTVNRQGTRSPSFTYTAVRDGLFTVVLSGDLAGFEGSQGNYTFRSKIKRVKNGKVTFDDPGGGAISFDVRCPSDALLSVKAKTKKGGFDLTDLLDPDGDPEPDFATSLFTKSNRRSVKLKKFPVTGGFGTYEVQGAYDAGSKVKIKAKVAPALKKVKLSRDNTEPLFDGPFHRFPVAGIEGSIFTTFGHNFGSTDDDGNAIDPTFWVGNAPVPAATLEKLSQGLFRFPIPAGLDPGETYDIRMRNPDGQGAVAPDAFEYVPPPEVFALEPTESGPAGGRQLEIAGRSFRGGTVVLFDGVVVQPQFVFETLIVVQAPAHAPGDVALSIRDEHGQVVAVPDTLTVLDIGSNEITSMLPDKLQAIGGRVMDVNGVDFGATSTLTLDGEELDASLISPTLLRFTTPIRDTGTLDLTVEDEYEQTSTLSVEVTGLADESDAVIPDPITTAGAIDGWRAARILRGDLNGDGHDDLVLLRRAVAFGDSANRSRIRVLLGNGTGSFTDGTSGIPAVSATDDWRAHDGVLFDHDDDDDLDIGIVSPDEFDDGDRSSLRILSNDGSAGFTDVTDTALPDESTWGDHNQGVALVAVDLTGDDVPELVVTHTESFLEVIDNSPPPQDPPEEPPPPPDIETFYYPGTRVLLNDGDGVFTRDVDALPEVDETNVMRFEGNALAVANVDGDGDLDIFVTRDGNVEDPDDLGTYLRVGFLLRNDTVTDLVFTDASDTLLPAAGDPEYLQGDRAYFHDILGNSSVELVIASNTRIVSPVTSQVVDAASLRIFEWSSGAFVPLAGGTLPGTDEDDQLQCEDVAFADLDGDTDVDLVIVSTSAPNPQERAARILRLNPDDTFTRASTPFPNPLLGDDARGAVVHVLDLEGDGDLDVLIGRDEPDESVRNTRAFVNERP